MISEGDPRIKAMYSGVSNSLVGGIFNSISSCKPHRLPLTWLMLKANIVQQYEEGSIPSLPAWAIEASKLPANQL